jgi:hypothetical protein
MSFGRRGWRALTACVAAYALALYTIALSFAPLPAASATPGVSAAGFEICQHDADPAAPTDRSDSHEHCKFCTANAHSLAALPRAPLPFIIAYETTLRWTVIGDETAPPPPSFSAQPRGPPLQA